MMATADRGFRQMRHIRSVGESCVTRLQGLRQRRVIRDVPHGYLRSLV